MLNTFLTSEPQYGFVPGSEMSMGTVGPGRVYHGWSGWVRSKIPNICNFYKNFFESFVVLIKLNICFRLLQNLCSYSDLNFAMSYPRCLISLFTMHSSRACHIYKTLHFLK